MKNEISCRPLSCEEKGRGKKLPQERLKQLQDFSAAWVLRGGKQYDCAKFLGGSRSQVSRWCQDGMRHLSPSLRGKLLKTRNKTMSQMIWSRIEISSPDECWPWIGFVKPNGYGSLNFKGHTVNAHRAVYELLVEPINPGFVIDHICSNKRCVNPRHLQQITQSLNIAIEAGRKAAS